MSKHQESFVGWDEVVRVSDMSRRTILRRIKDSEFPAYQPGKKEYKFLLSEVHEWMKQRKVLNVS